MDILPTLIFFILLALYWFTEYSKGFLLTRHQLPNFSTCDDVNDVDELSGNTDANECWMPKTFDRAIFFVIDALRFDFMESEHIPIFKQLLSSGSNCQLFKFIADSPTVTAPRIKGLTTGSIPTYISIGKNFHSDELDEDNVFYQLKDNGKNIVVLGDDTWHFIFPDDSYYARKRCFDSFNVYDLYTVDDSIMHYLMPEMEHLENLKEVYEKYEKNETGVVNNLEEFDLLVAHFLGLDHAGHRYGIFHEKLHQKLREYNKILEDLVNKLDDDTILFVFGDHAMMEQGDHGGNSKYEVETALFAYAKRDLGNYEQSVKTVLQIDLVPTVSLLLGLPIPFNNLGSVIVDLFKSSGSENDAIRINAWQVKRFAESYIKMDNEIISDELWVQFLSLYERQEYQTFIKEVELHFRGKWNIYDTGRMTLSMVITVISLFICVLLFSYPVSIGKWKNPGRATVPTLSIVVFFCLCVTIYTDKYLMFSRCLCILVMLYFGFVSRSTFVDLITFFSSFPWGTSKFNILLFFFVIAFFSCMFSNNGIIHEDKIVVGLISSIWILKVFCNKFWSRKKQLIMIVVVGVLMYLATLKIRFRSTECHILPQPPEEEFSFCSSILFFAFVLGILLWKKFKWTSLIFIIFEYSLILFYWIVNNDSTFPYVRILNQWIPRFVLSFLVIKLLLLHFFKQADRGRLFFETLISIQIILKGYSYLPVFIVLLLELKVLSAINERTSARGLFLQSFEWFLLMKHLFFAMGSQYTFTTFQWKAVMIGNTEGNMIFSALLIVFNYCSVYLMFCFFSRFYYRQEIQTKLIVIFWNLNFGINVFNQICSIVLIQHLMLWEVFAPKFIMEFFSLVFASIFLVLGQIYTRNLQRKEFVKRK